MRNNIAHQNEFSSLLFDTLFGLILFFNLDSFLDIKEPLNFIFYLFSTIILVHWWLIFKSSEDAFEPEVNASATDLLFGLGYIIFIEYIVLFSKTFNYHGAVYCLLSLLIISLIWSLVWRFAGQWQTKDKMLIKKMEAELKNSFICDATLLILTVILLIAMSFITPTVFLIWFIANYAIFIVLTFELKVIDLKWF